MVHFSRVLLLAFAVCLTECSDAGDSSSPLSEQEEDWKSFSRSPQDAVIIAQNYFNKMEIESRSSDPISARAIVSTSATRSGLASDTITYICQRGEDDGFVLVAADSRVDEILAYSLSGKFDYEPTYENPVYSEFISHIEPYMTQLVSESLLVDTLESRKVIGRFIVADEARWSQNDPYDKYVIINHPNCPVGCGAVAAGMVMLYCIDSLTCDNEFYDFQKIRYGMNQESSAIVDNGMYSYSVAVDKVAKLLSSVGESIGMTYSTDGSASHISRIYSYLKQLGLTKSEYENGYANYKELVKNMRENKELIFMQGVKYSPFGSHFWLVDGYSFQCVAGHANPIDTAYMSDVKLHCNWGWGGTSNGFYSGAVLNGYTPVDYIEVGTYKESKYNALNYYF